MTPLTQPETSKQIAENREWRNQGVTPGSDAEERARWYAYLPYTNEPTFEPVVIDWLEINREFS